MSIALLTRYGLARGVAGGGEAYATDFSEYTTAAGLPTGWTNRWNSEGYSVAENAGAVGGKWLSTSGGGTQNRLASWDDVGSVQNFDAVLITQVAFNNQIGAAGIVFRGDGTATTTAGYYMGLNAQNVVWRYFSATDGFAGTNSAAFAYSANVNQAIRVHANGNSFKVKAWLYGDSEPAGWLLEVTDTRFPDAGWVGVGRRDGFTVPKYDFFSVAVNGDEGSAPLPT